MPVRPRNTSGRRWRWRARSGTSAESSPTCWRWAISSGTASATSWPPRSTCRRSPAPRRRATSAPRRRAACSSPSPTAIRGAWTRRGGRPWPASGWPRRRAPACWPPRRASRWATSNAWPGRRPRRSSSSAAASCWRTSWESRRSPGGWPTGGGGRSRRWAATAKRSRPTRGRWS